MVASVLHELADPYPPLPSKEWWFLFEGVVQHLPTAWEQTCSRIIQTASAEELQATRDDYHAALLGYLKILDGCLAVMSRFNGDDSNKDLLNRISLSRDELQKHYDSLFPRWQTLDNLEAILLERISLPNEQLKDLAAKYPPPAAWYDEANEQLRME